MPRQHRHPSIAVNWVCLSLPMAEETAMSCKLDDQHISLYLGLNGRIYEHGALQADDR